MTSVYTTYWIDQLYSDSDYRHIRLKRLGEGYGGYPNHDIFASLVDTVGLDDFLKVEENRIPYFIGCQFGIAPRFEKIPGFEKPGRIFGKLDKSVLSGAVAGFSICRFIESDRGKGKYEVLKKFVNEPL